MALVPQMYFTDSFVQSGSHSSPSKRSIRTYRDEHLQQDIEASDLYSHLITKWIFSEAMQRRLCRLYFLKGFAKVL